MKAKLLQAIDEGQAYEERLAVFAVDKPANADGTWNAKDHLAHLSWWRHRDAQTLNALRTGGEMPRPVDEDDNVTNAGIYAEVKDRSVSAVKADAQSSWAALRNAVEASSEEELTRPHPRQDDNQVWEAVPGAVGHAGTHVWSWYLDIGDEERAIAGAQWSSEIEGRFFTTPEKLASATYNLACVYARLGRAEDALPLLRESFAARPSGKKWAERDTDLDRIRELPEFKELLAT